jgi:hypothetical protein
MGGLIARTEESRVQDEYKAHCHAPGPIALQKELGPPLWLGSAIESSKTRSAPLYPRN